MAKECKNIPRKRAWRGSRIQSLWGPQLPLLIPALFSLSLWVWVTHGCMEIQRAPSDPSKLSVSGNPTQVVSAV